MKQLREEALNLLNIELSDEDLAALQTYASELAAYNAHTNLTAITEPDAVRVRHFLDSLTVVPHMPLDPGTRVVDVGTGAGFPGMVLAIAFPQLKVTLMDATGKKIKFLQHIIDTLGLKNVTPVQLRAEDAGRNAAYREKFDVVLARAVARLPALLEYLLPLARVGGHCIAMKGGTAYTEAEDSLRALQVLGGQILDIEAVQLPGVEDAHYLVLVEKIRPTPKDYPRNAGTPTRTPIE